MKTRCFETKDRRVFCREWNSEDLIGKGPFKEMLGMVSERAARQKVKDICSLSAQLIMHDMIEHCDVFCLPVHQSGFLRISDMGKSWDVDKYHFHIKYDGKTYGGLIVMNHLVFLMNGGKTYRFIPTQEHLQRIRTLRSQGKRWP